MLSQTHVALITGGSRGIGAATARLLATHGVTVAINYLHNEAAATQLVSSIQAAGGKAYALQANVQNAEEATQLVQQVHTTSGRIDILVNNAPPAAIFKPSFQHMSTQEFLKPVVGELTAAFELTKAVAPLMIGQQYGRIVYMASGWARQPGMPGSIGAGTAKAALVMFAKYIAQELGPHGILANTVAPGLVETELSGMVPPEMKQRISAITPLRRIAQPEDVARVIAYLTSAENTFVTGTYTPVNGGQAMD